MKINLPNNNPKHLFADIAYGDIFADKDNELYVKSRGVNGVNAISLRTGKGSCWSTSYNVRKVKSITIEWEDQI